MIPFIVDLSCDHPYPSVAGNLPIKTLVARQWPTTMHAPNVIVHIHCYVVSFCSFINLALSVTATSCIRPAHSYNTWNMYGGMQYFSLAMVYAHGWSSILLYGTPWLAITHMHAWLLV